MNKITVLTGAGMSAESGLKTFRDAYGLWEGHDVMQVASPEGFDKNPELVLEFYNQRRKQLLTVEPNFGHLSLANLEKEYEIQIITQNVDDLHERAGSSQVLHLHGELLKVRCTQNHHSIEIWKTNLHLGDLSKHGHQLRPHIVWFGEEVPLLSKAAEQVMQSDALLIIGTSMQVYPAASLVHYAPKGIPMAFVDPKPNISHGEFPHIQIFEETAVKGVPKAIEYLKSRLV
jgi:NAD-dependent deacetylase